MDCSVPGSISLHCCMEFAQTHVHWVVMSSSSLILCCPLLLLPSIFSCIRVFSSESVLHIKWPKYWSFSFSISPFSEYSGLISFRTDWFDLLAVCGTLKSLLQHHSLKASVLLCSTFFMVQLSHPYIPTGKTIALTRWTFASKVISLLSSVLSTLVIAFLQGNQFWIFTERTDAEAEAPIFWPPDVKSQLIRKDPDTRKNWGQEEKGHHRMRWLDGIINSMDINLSKFREMVNNWEALPSVINGLEKSQIWLSDWTTTNFKKNCLIF